MEWNAELESVLRANPEDEKAWAVLEDWTLERGDLRAQILQSQRSRDRAGAARALRAWEREAFAKSSDDLAHLACAWRAGYLVSVSITARHPTSPVAILERALSLRCSPLLSRLSARIINPDELDPLIRRVGGHPLRQLSIIAAWNVEGPPRRVEFTFDASTLLSRLELERLHLFGQPIALPWRRELTRLTELSVTPGAPADLSSLFVGELPSLVQLDLSCEAIDRPSTGLAPFASVLSGARTPRLQHLTIRLETPSLRAQVLERLASSPLLPQLKTFSFAIGGRLDTAQISAKHRAAFAHLRGVR